MTPSLPSAGLTLRALRALVGAGVVAPVRPDRLLRIAAAGLRGGVGIGALSAMGAARHPGHPALVDELGVVTYGELERRAAAVAAALRDEYGVGPNRALAIMVRNHRGFVETLLAGSRLGADLLLLNTDFPALQLAQVLDNERPGAVVHDEEFGPAFDAAGFAGDRVVAWHDGDRERVTLDDLAGRDVRRARRALIRQGKVVILTSGTTGTPKGAPRKPDLNALVGPMTTLLSEVPFRAREPMLVGPPFFHGFGLAYLCLGLFLGSTIVMRRRFDPQAALADIDAHGVTVLAGVPVMFQRMLQVPEDVRRGYDTSSLRAAISAAAPLGAPLADAFMDEFGDVLYNLYGSTETGFGAIAGPADLRAAPGTVGRAPYGTVLKILREDRSQADPGETGVIFVGGEMVFAGYSGGGTKEVVEGLMNTGDLGHLDEAGRLFIDGREDDMIVSGGENVFPQEVEDVLARHDGVADVAVIGVPDEEFGQRLQAFVVPKRPNGPTEDELKAHVKTNLARYKVPRDVVFVDELPRNPTGKVLRRRLAELA